MQTLFRLLVFLIVAPFALIGAAILIGIFSASIPDRLPSPNPATEPPPIGATPASETAPDPFGRTFLQNVVSPASYRKLKFGMTYAEAVAAIGTDGERASESQFDGLSVYVMRWENRDGSNCLLTFEGGKLTIFANAGL